MGIITYDQETSQLHNEDGDFIGRIYREGDGLGPLIEERVNEWLALSDERDRLRERARILREALENLRKDIWSKDIPSPTCPEYVEWHHACAGFMEIADKALDATKEGA